VNIAGRGQIETGEENKGKKQGEINQGFSAREEKREERLSGVLVTVIGKKANKGEPKRNRLEKKKGDTARTEPKGDWVGPEGRGVQ